MGLFEKARHLAGAQLRALLEPGAAVPDEVLKKAVLELDGYRRELASQLAKHANEEAHLAREVARRTATVALWQARRMLARERGRAELAQAAEARAGAEAAERAALERKREVCHEAVANLTVGLEKVERTLRLVREKKLDLEAARHGGARRPEAASGAAAAAGAESGLVPRFALSGNEGGVGGETSLSPPDDDPLEAEFRKLEHEEVTRHIERLRGAGASRDQGAGGDG